MTRAPASAYIVDVEASTATPSTGQMTEFAVVHVQSGDTFYSKLYEFEPHPDNPAIPVVNFVGSIPVRTSEVMINGSPVEASNHREVAQLFASWASHNSSRTLVSDNPAFDGMWLNCFLDANGQPQVLGFSGRRIGDFAAGAAGNWNKHNNWKSLRHTKHTHHPLDDAIGNAEALCTLVGWDEPEFRR